ncbi:MAG: hypothetical protein WCY19_04495 [Candidatus Gastranaerophilaceae bacterium]
MGMSASQCRLLTLTSRLSDLELSAQSISNSKIRLSQRSEAIAKEYSDALDKKKLTVLSGYNSTTGASTYIDATAYNLTTYNAVSTMDKQRFLKDAAGRVLVSQDVADIFNYAIGQEKMHQNRYPTLENWLNSNGYTSDTNNTDPNFKYDAAKVTYYTNLYTGFEGFLYKFGYTSDPASTSGRTYDEGAVKYYANVFSEMKECGYNIISDGDLKNPDWLCSQLSSGNISLSEWDNSANNGTGDFVNVSWSSGDTTLQTKDDDAAATKAEAKYTADMAEVETKDKRFDLNLKNIDTEHTAVQTEVDTVKKVIDKNIEKSFKIFDA